MMDYLKPGKIVEYLTELSENQDWETLVGIYNKYLVDTGFSCNYGIMSKDTVLRYMRECMSDANDYLENGSALNYDIFDWFTVYDEGEEDEYENNDEDTADAVRNFIALATDLVNRLKADSDEPYFILGWDISSIGDFLNESAYSQYWNAVYKINSIGGLIKFRSIALQCVEKEKSYGDDRILAILDDYE